MSVPSPRGDASFSIFLARGSSSQTAKWSQIVIKIIKIVIEFKWLMGGAEEFFMREIEDAGQVRFFFKFLEETDRRDRELLLIPTFQIHILNF